MKINSKQNTVVTNNQDNSSTSFGISDQGKIAEILRKRLYSKPKQTLVQEYVCNARDACTEAGLPLKVTITLPTPNNKVFKVRDHGVGLSPERIKDVFVNYGSSTKNKDNSQIGGFGIGAKSAWAYTDNFTIVSYYQGMARHYIAHIGKNNMGTLDLVNEVKTSEPNGTEIQIAVAEKDIPDFINAVYRCTYFWETRPELRGIAPSEVPDWYKNPVNVGSILNVKFYDRKQLHELGGSENFLVVDGIPYPLTYQFFDSYKEFIETKHRYCIFLKTGQVDVSASREAITDNEESQQSLTAMFKKLTVDIEQYIKEKLTNSENLAEFLQQYKTFQNIYDIGLQKYKSYAQDIEFEVNNNYPVMNNIQLKLEKTSQGDKWRLDSEENAWDSIYNYKFLYSAKEINKATLFSKVKQYLNQFPETEKRQALVFYPNQATSQTAFNSFVTDIQALDIASIELDKKQVTKRPTNELKVTVVDAYRRYRNGHDTETIDLNTNTVTWVYEVKAEDFTNQKNQLSDMIATVRDKTNMKFCFIAESNLKKIENDPKFLAVKQFLADPFTNLKVNIKDDILNKEYGNVTDKCELFISLTLTKILDKEIVTIVNRYKKFINQSGFYYSSHNKVWESLKQKYVELNKEIGEEIQQIKIDEKVLTERYPLVSNMSRSFLGKDTENSEYLWYVNAKYKEKYEK